MSRKKRYAQAEVTTEAQITAPDLEMDATTTLRERIRGIGLRCECGAEMLVERTRWPGKTYPGWLRTPYRVWRCPRCRKTTRQEIKRSDGRKGDGAIR